MSRYEKGAIPNPMPAIVVMGGLFLTAIGVDIVTKDKEPIKITPEVEEVASASQDSHNVKLFKSESAAAREFIDCGREGGIFKTEKPKIPLGKFVLCLDTGENYPVEVVLPSNPITVDSSGDQ